MLFLKTENQESFCCADCAAGVSNLDLTDLSLAGLKIPFTNRHTDDFLLQPGEHKTIGICNPFRFIGMATAKPIKMGFRGKYESNKFLAGFDVNMSTITNVGGLNEKLSIDVAIVSKTEDFDSTPALDQYVLTPGADYSGTTELQILNNVIAGDYSFSIEVVTGVILTFTMAIQTNLSYQVTGVKLSGLYNGDTFSISNATGPLVQSEFVLSNLKKYVTFNNVFMADATYLGTVDMIELWNDTLAPVRVLLISAS